MNKEEGNAAGGEEVVRKEMQNGGRGRLRLRIEGSRRT